MSTGTGSEGEDGVAAGAARDEETAIRACDLIEIEYEVLSPVLSLDEAEADDAPLVHETDWKQRTRKSNLCKKVELGFGDVEDGLAQSHATVSGSWFFEGTTHAPIEPHCAIGHMDEGALPAPGEDRGFRAERLELCSGG